MAARGCHEITSMMATFPHKAAVPVHRPGRSVLAFAAGLALVLGSQNPGAVASAHATGRQLTVNVLGVVIDGASGKPLVGARVQLQPAVASVRLPASGLPSSGGPAEVRTSDSAGSFTFAGIAPGLYRFNATASGYLTSERGGAAPTNTLVVWGGEKELTITIRLSKPAAIAGVVTDEAGDPAVGIPVRLLKLTFQGGRRRAQLSAEAATNDRGAYRFGSLSAGDFVVVVPFAPYTVPRETLNAIDRTFNEGLAATRALAQRFTDAGVRRPMGNGQTLGEFHLEAFGKVGPGAVLDEASGVVRSVYGTTYFSRAAIIDEATPVMVGSGEERLGVDLSLLRVQPTRVSGTISTPDGPVALQGLVLVSPSPAGWVARGPETAVASAVSDTQGRFTFLGVPAGRYLLRAVRSSGTDATNAGFAELPIDVSAAPTDDLRVTLQAGKNVRGRLQFGDPAVKADPQTLLVSLQPVSGMLAESLPPVRPNAEGAFQTQRHPPGRYILTVAGDAGWSVKSVRVGTIDVTDKALDLDQAENSEAVVTLTNKQASVAGTVDDAAPVHSIIIVAFPAAYEEWMAAGFAVRRLRTAFVNAKRQFAIDDLPNGTYLMTAVIGAVPRLETPETIERLSRRATRVVVPEAGRLQVQLRAVPW